MHLNHFHLNSIKDKLEKKKIPLLRKKNWGFVSRPEFEKQPYLLFIVCQSFVTKQKGMGFMNSGRGKVKQKGMNPPFGLKIVGILESGI